MKVISSIGRLQQVIKQIKKKNLSIGFVPTMGALHNGHGSLINASCKENDITVVSIFVNPLQFGPKEDLKQYPRPFKSDLAFCRKLGVDILFHPSAEQMYPESFSTSVEVKGLSDVLEGKFRPGHFRGVATVVAKLFCMIMPDKAYFGQKDAQQAIIIERMTKDLAMPIKIKVLPIIREPDGLAMSSRNIYLSKSQRQNSVVLYKALTLARQLINSGQRDAVKVISRMKQLIKTVDEAKIDYITVVEPYSLKPVSKITNGCLICLAVRFGSTRLIDNIVVGDSWKLTERFKK
ncbi:MAG: pantoate--beta-alanine ligase [Candidatus Omnitrophica bacterium]|nr:pantoate--beta-alanine ligase [Candidatus Omnitrophota bacterium]